MRISPSLEQIGYLQSIGALPDMRPVVPAKPASVAHPRTTPPAFVPIAIVALRPAPWSSSAWIRIRRTVLWLCPRVLRFFKALLAACIALTFVPALHSQGLPEQIPSRPVYGIASDWPVFSMVPARADLPEPESVTGGQGIAIPSPGDIADSAARLEIDHAGHPTGALPTTPATAGGLNATPAAAQPHSDDDRGLKEVDLLRQQLLWAERVNVLLSGALVFAIVWLVFLRLTGSAPRPAAQPVPTLSPQFTERAARVREDEIPDSAAALAELVASGSGISRFRATPRPAIGRWNMAMVSIKGFVRDENQDFGLAFEIGGLQVAIVADGCGGIPFGKKAAYLATVSAAEALISRFGNWSQRRVSRADALRHSMAAASERLTEEGHRTGLRDPRDGLRTTLVIVVADKHAFSFGYIGDGGGYVLRSDGRLDRFLNPMKDEDSPNVLKGSLGPKAQGEPVFDTVPRHPGDLLVMGTDGVFDRVDDTFCKGVLRSSIEHDGNLEQAVRTILAQFAGYRDELGFVCDDNLTLAVIGDRQAPKLGAGFWTSARGEAPLAAVSAARPV